MPKALRCKLPSPSILLVIGVFVLVYIALDLNKLYALRYGQDQGTFLQFLVDEARHASSWNGAEMRPHLQVHDSWTLLLFVPAIALIPRQETLIVLQVLLVALATLPLFAFARACGADRRGANAVALAYIISPSAQSFAYSNFIENLFIPILAFPCAIAVRKRAFVPSLIFAQLLLGIKEDQAPFLCWFGLACFLWWDRRIGAGIVVLALLNGAGFYIAEHVHHVAPALPAYSLLIFDPVQKFTYFVSLLAMSAFAPLALRWRLLLAAPLVAELVFARPWAYPMARIGVHYTAAVFTATMLATAYVVAKHPKFVKPVVACAILSALLLNDTVLKIGRWPYVVDWPAYHTAYALVKADRSVIVPRADEGAYAVAASNLNVVLAPEFSSHNCLAYNVDAGAFFASIGIGTWPSNATVCGGVVHRLPP